MLRRISSKKCWFSEPSCLSSFGHPENYMKKSMFGACLFYPAWSQTILHRKHLLDELDKSEPPLFWHGHQSKPPASIEHTPTLEPSNPQWFNPWNLSKTKRSLIWGHFFRSKKSVSTRSVFTLAPPLGFPNLSRKPTTKKAPVTKQGDQPFSKRESFSHWTVVCSQLSWQTDARWIQFELLVGCETVRALAVRSEIWKVETCFFSKMTLKESTNDSGV